MGNKYEVYEYVLLTEGRRRGQYDWSFVYMGESMVKALWSAAKAKRAGAGAIRIEWR